MSRSDPTKENDRPLFLTDEQLWPLISPHIKRSAFIAIIKELEFSGFPRCDPLFKGRYWPAVLAWLDRRAGIGSDEASATDGEDTWEKRQAKRRPPADMRLVQASAEAAGVEFIDRGQPEARLKKQRRK